MSKDARHDPADPLQGVIDLIRARLPRERRAETERLVHQYYAQVDPEDLADCSPDDLYGAALSHLGDHSTCKKVLKKSSVFFFSLLEHCWSICL